MPNNNYRRGAEAERNAVKELKALGYIACRSAASQSAFDVWAVRGEDVVLIQSKRGGKPSPKEYESAVLAQVPENVIVLVLWYPEGLQAPRVLWYNRLPEWLLDSAPGTAPRVRWFVGDIPKQPRLALGAGSAPTAPPTRRPRARKKPTDDQPALL